MFDNHKVAVVIPCYKVKDSIAHVIQDIPNVVDYIICVDDACPEKTEEFIRSNVNDPRIEICCHSINQGVGGAMLTGYKWALERGADIVVKIDGDRQMDASLIAYFIAPIVQGKADYTKGNRFYNIEDIGNMPVKRVLGNIVLSFFNKFSSGYWNIFDPTNGYTAIHAKVLSLMPFDKISKRYFFESDMLFRLNTVRAKVIDIPMKAVYGDEKSSMRLMRIVPNFLKGHMINLGKRIFYNYLLRDFSVASIELTAGMILVCFGFFFGLYVWFNGMASNTFASTGTIMLSVLPIIIGTQLLLSFMHYDISIVPEHALHPLLSLENCNGKDVSS